nr:glycosyltransferase [uncultured Blautia sp.]
MDKICVLMSTYNGEKYLIEQIESILTQKDVEVTLVVRDDGSSDSTISILNEYQEQGKLSLISDNCNLGPACSFMKLLYGAEDFAYYAFADQDDIWRSEKLITAIAMIKDNEDVPALYCSNQWILEEGKIKGLRFTHKEHGIVQAICGNVFSGCTMVFNKKLFDILKQVNNRPSIDVLKTRMHDTWVIAVAECTGVVVYDENSYIEYRIHENNTVGLKKGKIKRLKCRIINKNYRNGRSKLAAELIKLPIYDKKNYDIVKAFATRNRIGLLKKSIIKNSNDNYFIIKTLFGMN